MAAPDYALCGMVTEISWSASIAGDRRQFDITRDPGKTVIFTRLIDRVEPPTKDAPQTLILAHRRELVEQAARHCESAYPDKSIDIEMGDIHASGAADITVASVRSLVSGERLTKYNPARFKLVLVDEAHHIVAPGYLQVLEHFGLEEKRDTGPALVGVSATFSRFDGLRLGAAIDHIVYHKDYVDMIGEKWLSDVMFTTVKSKADLSKVRSGKDGDFQTGQLAAAVNTEITNDITVKAWMEEANTRKSTLVFCVDINHVVTLTAMFRRYGVDAQYITGSTKKRLRGERLEAFKNREFPILLNCGVFTEGTDMPNIDCVLLARPTKSRNLLVQMIGRGMRLYPGKEDCHVIDMVASLETGIVTVPTLFGLDPSEVVTSAKVDDLQNLKNKRVEEALVSGEPPVSSNILSGDHNLSFTHYDSVHDLIEDTSGERHVRAISPYAWVQIDSHKYVLTAKGGILTLERRLPTDPTAKDSESTFAVIWKHSLPPMETSKSPWSRPRTVATASTLSDALHAADTFAASKFERIFIAKSSPWRKLPASSGQLDFLNKLREVSEEEPLTEDDVTKGQAGDMITKVKFGARGRFDKLMKVKRGVDRQAEKGRKVMEMRERETVRVGPVEA
ncbi:putative ATP-dependent helicase IRC3 [Cladophialophora chaetospira]|uniref:ATP-dependent helicase IRC3 n=1 Tax=Cladophialophora chaetospira TaxID=386627 RepID=A0AA38X7P3_9EURO|nr:putative ATP-dependent helicase IRC3 [Cladophialophora chaetospira]